MRFDDIGELGYIALVVLERQGQAVRSEEVDLPAQLLCAAINEDELSEVAIAGGDLREDDRAAAGGCVQIDDRQRGVERFARGIGTLSEGDRGQLLVAFESEASREAGSETGEELKDKSRKVFARPEFESFDQTLYLSDRAG